MSLLKTTYCTGIGQVRLSLYQSIIVNIIISLGYKIKSKVVTNFRKWATERLKEYMIKGFTINDERLKENDGGNFQKYILFYFKLKENRDFILHDYEIFSY